jgi:hypothetical protein
LQQTGRLVPWQHGCTGEQAVLRAEGRCKEIPDTENGGNGKESWCALGIRPRISCDPNNMEEENPKIIGEFEQI